MIFSSSVASGNITKCCSTCALICSAMASVTRSRFSSLKQTPFGVPVEPEVNVIFCVPAKTRLGLFLGLLP
ncbi:Uncharacterised protein [Vibrio cholerae]|nr:Uncharacterised protein [Vibrio cholerae]CSB33960.1 Uncharacterised protein [Vibrio cholerae]CSB75233.1 Uncharacterised protein [Vibrio cholerae]CSC89715.1 Uncharacterised protein [Vibrio cholerae]